VRDWMPHASLVLQVSCFVSLIAPTLKHWLSCCSA
jgi:hypothetical protein